jgi:hypothetical protein
VGTGVAGALLGHVPGAIVGVFVSTCGSGLLRPMQDEFRRFVEWLESTKCRILLYGLGGTGKTELRRRFLKKGDFIFGGPPTPTPDIDWADITVGKDSLAYKVRVNIFDYSGQQSSQVVGDGSPSFFGPSSDRRVHVIFFVVDHFGPILGPDHKQIPDEELVAQCAESGLKLVHERVQKNTQYLDEFHLQEVFDKVVNPEAKTPRAVRLLINKKELIGALLERSSEKNSQSVYDFAIASYADVIAQLQRACEKYNVGDFRVELTSSTDEACTAEILVSILTNHFRR